ncbi:MAG: hypothetical protein KKE39_05420 [Bacteroidetes bacterium]|nr:hypothetical protein [Bacteroidota bacterium]MBU1371685.1 hypothetical protein [Bacteroidota bacterium]MBU1486084.1 hypothetical protein [Bacteroidota bacterium]MBU1759591.1 hypothetical protein [Bacteroidota bacterium]MBU2047322.1 hypothetical protein [Bacteroidota bacterium]
MKKVKTLAILNFIFFVIAFTVSNLSQLKLFGGQTNADVSGKYETVFTPAGITFAIWGVIYLSLFGFTIFHLIKAYQEDVHSEASQSLLKIGNLFILNNIATTFWVFAFTYEYLFLSMVLIIIQLITLLLIFIRLNLWDLNKSFNNKLYTQFPLSIYFAWLCVACAANISLYLVAINFDGFGIIASDWAIILIIIVTLVSIFIVGVKKNVSFGLVIIWAFYGIYLKQQDLNPLASEMVIRFSLYGMMFTAIVSIITLVKNWRYKRREVNA